VRIATGETQQTSRIHSPDAKTAFSFWIER